MKIGILGNGQLGMMLGEAADIINKKEAKKLQLSCYAPGIDVPASYSCQCVDAAYENEKSLTAWITDQDVITYEFENIPAEAIKILRNFAGKIAPSTIALETMQNRIREKSLATAHGAKTALYKVLDQETLEQRMMSLKDYFLSNGVNLIVKTASFGYDGKGQAVVRTEADLLQCEPLLSQTVCIAEQFVPFETEASLISCRGADGTIVHYPLTENFHRKGILRVSRPLVENVASLQRQAQLFAEKVLNDLRYVGIMTIEFFVLGDELYVNEFAPRVHNSGHWTIEGSETSQFENHVRAVAGFKLGSTVSKPALMYNLIGSLEYDLELLAEGKLHAYHKGNRPDRKVGHVTIVSDTYKKLPQTSLLLQNLPA